MKWNHYYIAQVQSINWLNPYWLGLIGGLLLLTSTSQGVAQSVSPSDTSYKSRVQHFIDESEKLVRDERYQLAERKAREALALSQQKNYAEGEIKSVDILSDIYRQQGDYLESVKYNLWGLRALEQVGDQMGMMRKYEEIGYLYFEAQAYSKAVDYFLTFQKVREKVLGKSELPTKIIEILEQAHLRLREYTKVKDYSSELLQRYRANKDTSNLTKTYRILAVIAKEEPAYEEAITYNRELLKIYEKQDNLVQLAYAYNNLGFLYKRVSNLKLSLEHFQRAIALKEDLTTTMKTDAQVSLLTNIGVAYTNLSLYLRAKDYYLQALRLQQQQEDRAGEAHLYNHLASNYFVSGKNAQALQAVNTAIDIGITYNTQETLATSYQILSLIYGTDNNENKARLYQEKFREISESLKNKKAAQFEEMLDRQLAIEEREDQIKTSLTEQERQALSEERRENELALLRRDQELQAIALQNQQLEKQRATQALALAQEQLRVEKRNQELRELERQQQLSERQRQLQDLQLQQQNLEKQEQKKTIALLEADQRLKEQKLREEAVLRKYAYGIIGLILVVLVIIGFSFIQKKKDNRKLQRQQDEIQEKNEQLLRSDKELRQNMEQLQSAQVVLEDQKWQLEEQKLQLEIEYRKTQESIHYAKRIQFSILPSDQQCATIVPESFVIYRPKDIVSGDFYWVSQLDTKKIISVIDCTGHGVPGSLVSLIGNNLLNEAINEHHLTDPAEILRYLDVKVRQKLRHDEEKNRDGMDMGMCVLEEIGEEISMIYGGAQNSLFVVMGGELHVLKGTRKSIGGKRRSKEFSQQQVSLQRGDCIYLTTDGYIDQANPARERFGSGRLRQLISEIYHLPMQEQGRRFEEALDAHQQNVEQRDDINLIGIRV